MGEMTYGITVPQYKQYVFGRSFDGPRERGSKGAGRTSGPAERASELSGRASKPAGRSLKLTGGLRDRNEKKEN